MSLEMKQVILKYLHMVHWSVRFGIHISKLKDRQTKIISLRSIPSKYINIIPNFSDVLYCMVQSDVLVI